MSDLDIVSGSSISLSEPVMRGFGCGTCVWKMYGECPKGFTKVNESLPSGYCDELKSFILGLASPGDGVSAVKEKFMLYTQELQARADHVLFWEKTQRYDDLVASGVADGGKLAELKMEIQSYKLWWHRLTESIVKGLGKVSDRERRSKDVESGSSKVSVHQLNVWFKESAKTLEGSTLDVTPELKKLN